MSAQSSFKAPTVFSAKEANNGGRFSICSFYRDGSYLYVMNINVGDLVIFKYERKNPKAKVGLVLKKEFRAMPRYAGYATRDNLGRDIPVDPLMEEQMCCFCLWTHTVSKSHNKWWVPVANLKLVTGEEESDA